MPRQIMAKISGTTVRKYMGLDHSLRLSGMPIMENSLTYDFSNVQVIDSMAILKVYLCYLVQLFLNMSPAARILQFSGNILAEIAENRGS